MILYPKAMFNKVSDITTEFLKQNNIKALILDVDNTLIDISENLSEQTKKWAEAVKKENIKLYILSNSNKKEKVKKVAEKLGIPYEYFGKKPLKSGFLKVQKILKEEPQNIGVIGDQIFTDIIGGNRCKMFTILVKPIKEKEMIITKWKRTIEEKIKKHYRENKGE